MAELGVLSQLPLPPLKHAGCPLGACQSGDFDFEVATGKIAYRVLLGFRLRLIAALPYGFGSSFGSPGGFAACRESP